MTPQFQHARSRTEVFEEDIASVLVVDDNAANLLAVEAILAPLAYRTVSVASADEALKQLLQREFAVILMDVQMPGMDGFEAAAAIKAHPRTADIPIIFITAISRETAHIFKGYVLGAVDYLLKPFEPEILRAKVAVFVDLYQKEQKIRAQAKLLLQHELRAAQRRSDERYNSLTESMPLPMWRLKTDGSVVTSNRAWLEYSGLTAEQTNNLFAGESLHADDVEAFRSAWCERIWREATSFDLEARLRTAGGEYRWHLFRVVPERSERGVLSTWIVTATDNDAQKRAQEMAEAANRLKDDFLATVSHELRTPLNAIVGWARMLRDGMLDGALSARALDAIERNAHAQTELVNDILDVSRIVTGKLRLQIAPIDLATVVQDAVDSVRPAASAKDIEIACRMEWDESTEIAGDPARLQQVVWNLVANAVKFSKKAGRVEVTLGARGGRAEIRVQDAGTGISREFLPFVFDRFRQADSSHSRAHTGLGLGLAIVRHLVELHGGTVRAESDGVDRGSTFIVTLPLGIAPSSALEPDWLESSPSVKSGRVMLAPRLDGLTVLFVEDDADAREVVTQMLGRYGAQVIAVESAAMALDALATSRPDVLVSDIGLPHSDGYALIREIRSRAPEEGGHIPAIAVTGYARVEDGRRALAAGFQMHLAKPVEPTELVALVASLAAKPALDEAAPRD